MRAPVLFLALAACGGEGPIDVGDACAPEPSLVGGDLVLDAPGCASATLSLRAIGSGSLEVTWSGSDAGFAPTVSAGEGGGTLRAVVASGAWEVAGGEDAVLWRQGYQSWSWSGVLGLTEPSLDAEGVPIAAGDGDGLSLVAETPGTSWWHGLVGRPDGVSLLMGSLSALRTKVYTAYSPDTAWVVWGNRGEALTLAPGETVALDPLWLAADEDAWELHRTYAERVAEVVLPRNLDGSEPPAGWATWYVFYSAVTEADVRANLDVLATVDRVGLDVVQIDDGWQRLWGDWTADDGFPSGMAALASDIRAAGYTPGVWMAPFYVHRDTVTFRDHPDWWVRDPSTDEPIVFTNLGTGDYVIVDATHPDAGPWMAAQVRAMVDAGYGYLKLDFLYAGAQEGVRVEDVTGMEAYHRGMALLREAAGDAWVLACGAPWLPSVGYAESMRTGADIAFEVAPDPDLAFVRWQARQTAARGFAQGIWWWNDPDAIIYRHPAPETLVSGALVNNMVSGGTWLLGDDLADLDADRLARGLDPDLLALRGAVVRPQDPLRAVSGFDASPVVERAVPDDHPPVRWILSTGETALLNLTDLPVTSFGPGGTELLSGAAGSAGEVTLEPGEGQVWR